MSSRCRETDEGNAMDGPKANQAETVHSAEDYDDYCMWVGRCLSAWSLVEARLNQTLSMSLNNASGAHEAYWAVVSFDARLKMTTTALLHRLEGRSDLIEKWRPIEKKVVRKSRQRNRIGHGTVMTIQSGPKPYVRVIPYLWKDINKLSPAEMEDAMNMKQLVECCNSFNHTEERIVKFLDEVAPVLK